MEAEALLQEASNDGESQEELKQANEKLSRLLESKDEDLAKMKLQLIEAQQNDSHRRDSSWERSGEVKEVRGRDSWGSQGSKGKDYEGEIE